jgi:hypothetical protein
MFITVLTNARHLPYTKPGLSSPSLHITLLEDPFYYYTPNYDRVFQVVCSPRVSSPNPVGTSPDYITRHMPQSTLSIRRINAFHHRHYSICQFLKFSGALESLTCYMQIGVQEPYFQNPTKNSKELPSNMQRTKLPNLVGRREDSQCS